MKQTEHPAARLIEWLQDFKTIAVECGKMQPDGAIYIGLYHDGTGTITFGCKTYGSSLDPIGVAFDSALEWLELDNAAQENATLGLTPAGKFRDEPAKWFDPEFFDAAAHYQKDFNFQDPFKCPL